jgi:methoxymalonate biosynthesis protein
MNPRTSHQLAIIGAGVMGTGIATLALAYGMPVALVDNDPDALRAAPGIVNKQLRMARLVGQLSTDRPAAALTCHPSITEIRMATVAVEAVVEIPDVKYAVLSAAAAAVPAGTPLLSTTSAIPIQELAAHTGPLHESALPHLGG